MKKKFYIFAIMACLIYIITVVIGGILTPSYSHINNAISEIEVLIGENNKVIITTLFIVYNTCVLIYGSLLFKYNSKTKMKKVQAISIALIGLCGLLLYFFPADLVGSSLTIKGTFHIALVSVIAPLTMLISILGFWIYKDNPKFKYFSLIALIVIMIFGSYTAYLAGNGIKENFGIFERITIGTYITWLFVTSLYEKKSTNINLKN